MHLIKILPSARFNKVGKTDTLFVAAYVGDFLEETIASPAHQLTKWWELSQIARVSNLDLNKYPVGVSKVQYLASIVLALMCMTTEESLLFSSLKINI